MYGAACYNPAVEAGFCVIETITEAAIILEIDAGRHDYSVC